MGKKRSRVPGEPRGSSKTEATNSQHLNTLEDIVREQRDVQFAQEKKQTERAKRRRMVSENDTKALESTLSKPSSAKEKNRKTDVRTAGLQMWREAASKRKKKQVSNKTNGENENEDEDEDEDDSRNELAGVDGKTEKRIIEEARQQRAEIRKETQQDDENDGSPTESSAVDEALRTLTVKNNMDDSDDDSDEDDNSGRVHGNDRDDGRSVAGDTEHEWRSTVGEDERDLEFLDGSKVTEADELALSLFASEGNVKGSEDASGHNEDEENNNGGKIMLADIILRKIQEKEQANARAAAIAADPEKAERDRKIAEVYGLVGNIMSRYRSGKVPKAFKVIPNVQDWEELLYLTRPDEWSPAAMYVATRILASNLSGKQVVPFYTDILLPRCMEDISTNKKLNVHLYRALTKAVYKPDAFCKGILFPLCEDGECTLRQATIISSVVAKVSIPMLHSAAALLFMCQMKFSLTVCLLVTALIEKKYALPYRVLDAAVGWFVGMKEDLRKLPLTWHKCLLVFAQRYKTELTTEQKERLKILMRVHTHNLITPEIRRELFSARNRGDLMDPDANTIAKNIANAAMID